MGYFETIMETVDFLKKYHTEPVKMGIILGSGLGKFCDAVEKKHVIDYRDIPNFPVSTVKGHKGKLVIAYIDKKPIAIMQGRFHYYEGYTMKQITFPVRVFKFLGIDTLIITNSAGGISTTVKPGDFMIIKDHINLMADNPLIGHNDVRLGPRFPSMNDAYNPDLIRSAKNTAKKLNIDIKAGVYAGLTGPNYETPAEVAMLKTLGADAVGMSTVPEVIAARHSGIKVLGISCITNMAAALHGENPNKAHESVIDMAGKRSSDFIKLLLGIVREVIQDEDV